MTTPSTLMFLELEGVLSLGSNSKRQQVDEAVRSIVHGDSNWRDHHGVWSSLFETEPVRQLRSLHAQFQPQYCLTSTWTGFMDKAITLIVLRLSGLGFVASNLHAHWEIERGVNQATCRAEEIERWLHTNSAHASPWVVIDAEAHDPAILNWPEHLQSSAVFCCGDAGLTGFESDQVRARLAQKLHIANLRRKAEVL